MSAIARFCYILPYAFGQTNNPSGVFPLGRAFARWPLGPYSWKVVENLFCASISPIIVGDWTADSQKFLNLLLLPNSFLHWRKNLAPLEQIGHRSPDERDFLRG